MLSEITAAAQLIFTFIIGMYFFMKIRSESAGTQGCREESKVEAERLNQMRHIHLTEPLTEKARPSELNEIIGQNDGIRALQAALFGENPQHVIIYGPPGVGKTAAARVVMEAAKKSSDSPFSKDAPFVEADATIMRFDERSIADPLIGSVHDPIYQGAGDFGNMGIPVPKEGAVSRAHGGILFIDEIGELHPIQLNRLLKVLEDRKVSFESAYYSKSNKKIPTYIHDIFQNGIPADFRLVGATTRRPDEIPEAVRSRCVEVFFSALKREDVERIVMNACVKIGVNAENGVKELISLYAENGRDAVKILQTSANIVHLDGRKSIRISDVEWVIKMGRYNARHEIYDENDRRIIGIRVIKPE